MNNATLEMIVKVSPEKRFTDNGKAIAEFIATIPQLDARSIDKDVKVTVFGKRAETLPMFPVGQSIVVIGNINIDSVDNPAGYKDKVITVIANDILTGSLSPLEVNHVVPTQPTQAPTEPNTTAPKAPKGLLDAIKFANDSSRLDAIKANADSKGIAFESYKAEWLKRKGEIVAYDDIPF